MKENIIEKINVKEYFGRYIICYGDLIFTVYQMANLLNMNINIIEIILTGQYNGHFDDKGISFDTNEEANEALDWLIPRIIMNKLKGVNFNNE
ncbi:MAG: hypothetical protein ACOCP8_02000 [archaeon]